MMYPIIQLEPNICGVLLLLSWLVFLLTLYSLISLCWLRRERQSLIFAVFILLLAYAVLQQMLLESKGIFLIPLQIPVLYYCIAEILLCAMVILQQFHLQKWLKVSLSSMSVKEALDSLPTGLLFYSDDGVPRLFNERMNRICLDAFDMPLHNGEEFAGLLYHGDIREQGKEPGDQVLVLPDRSVYSFRLSSVEVANRKYHELVASDITQEWQLKKELEEQQKKAKQINIRLKSLLDTIEYVTMSRELLQFKTTLHDNIGRNLLYAKRWLLNPEKADKTEVLDLFRTNIRGLKTEEPEQWQTPYYVIQKQAKQLGIDLHIDGKLPEEDEELISLIDTALSVQMTNVLRHAEGSRVDVKVTENGDFYDLHFTNDGRKPEGEIIERGGLTNLRREVEFAHGTMDVFSVPEIVLLIRLPRKRGSIEEGR